MTLYQKVHQLIFLSHFNLLCNSKCFLSIKLDDDCVVHFIVLRYFLTENNAPAENRTTELYVECALYIDGAPFGLPTRTRLLLFQFNYFAVYVCILHTWHSFSVKVFIHVTWLVSTRAEGIIFRLKLAIYCLLSSRPSLVGYKV